MTTGTDDHRERARLLFRFEVAIGKHNLSAEALSANRQAARSDDLDQLRRRVDNLEAETARLKR